MSDLDYLGCPVHVDRYGVFVVNFEGDEETFASYAEAKTAIEAFAKRQTESLALAVVDDTGKKATIEGVNRTSSILRGPGLSTSTYGRQSLYPDTSWIAKTVGELVRARAEVDGLEEKLLPYQLHPDMMGSYGRMPISKLNGVLNSIKTDYEQKLEAAKARASQG